MVSFIDFYFHFRTDARQKNEVFLETRQYIVRISSIAPFQYEVDGLRDNKSTFMDRWNGWLMFQKRTKSNMRGKAFLATQLTEHLASTMKWCQKILFNTPK